MVDEQGEAAPLLVRVAQDADEHDGRMQVSGDINVVHCDQAGVADLELAADDFADFALEQFAHPLKSEGRHWSQLLCYLLHGIALDIIARFGTRRSLRCGCRTPCRRAPR